MSTPTPMVIDFLPSGAVEAMHRENVLDLAFLGPQEIERATDIRFEAVSQSWGLWLSDGRGDFTPPCEGAKGFPTYEEARTVEVAWLERCRLHERDPASHAGQLILAILRGG